MIPALGSEARSEPTLAGRTNASLNNSPECKPGAAGCAVTAGLDANLDNADDGSDDADEAHCEDPADAEFLGTGDFEVPYQADWENHDCEVCLSGNVFA